MPRIYSYVVAHDTGAAPNVEGGYCTLAICKPVIRRGANPGDWVVGLWPVPNRYRVTFFLQIADAIPIGDYWNDDRFQHKKPGRSKTPDNIYRHTLDGPVWVPNRIHPISSAAHDLGGRRVLFGDRFWYFGANPVELPAAYKDLDLPNPRRGHRVQTWSDAKLGSFVEWLRSHGNGVCGDSRDHIPDTQSGEGRGPTKSLPRSRC